ncbi:MAG: putative transmembrane protein YxlG [Firmicutes bacterium ADurb.Bin419]|nr:MAG: putative transmembrane protein YxlG [Firmicutes bacterium ADurb.Bin419]
MRTKKFLVLAIGVLFFAISDPIMLKLLPEILKNEMQGADLSMLLELSQKAALDSYTNNLFQLSTLIIVLSMMGIISKERSDKTLTIPVSMGCSINGMVSAKLLVYGVFILLINVVGMLVAYYYSGIIFGFTYGSLFAAAVSGAVYGLFFVFVLSILILASSFVKKSFLAVTVTLLFVYLMPLAGNFERVKRYLPVNLLSEANYFADFLSKNMVVSLICTIGLTVIFSVLSVFKLERVEFV